MKTLGRPQRHFKRNVNWFWWHWPTFFKELYRNLQKKVHNPKGRRSRFQKRKNCFFNNWYCKSQIHDLKPIIKRSFRQPAQSKGESAFEQKTRIVSIREISGSSQNRFFSYNRSNKPTRAQRDIFGAYSTSFWKVSVFLKKQKLILKVFDITRHLKRRMWRAKLLIVAFEN